MTLLAPDFHGSRAEDPATGDICAVYPSSDRGLLYSINDSPGQQVPARVKAEHREPLRMAIQLLVEHQRACQPAEAEEQTLP